MTISTDVLVIGAGVSGLTTALVLLESGLAVTIYAADPPHRTTSVAAGALWGAHLVGADDRVAPWGLTTLRMFRVLSAEPASGVTEMRGLAAFLSDRPEVPEFAAGLPGLTPADAVTLPPGYNSGWRYSAPVITMPTYLDYLVDRVTQSGGRLTLGRPFRDLTEAAADTTAPVLVNCTGMGARELAADAGLIPVRGQVVVVANPGVTEFFVGERELPGEITYFFPHGPTVLLGGVEQHGDDSREPDQDVADRIARQCADVEPKLAGAHVLAHRVGLRPVRRQVRLEPEKLADGRPVVHNYGHGGSGVTLSWGCAEAVKAEVLALLGAA